MPIPRFRFTVRRMMVAVALVVIVLGVASLLAGRTERAGVYRQRAVWFDALGRYTIGEADELRTAINAGPSPHPEAKKFPAYEVKTRARARHYLDLAAKYRRAARYSWLPVEPDPPEPE